MSIRFDGNERKRGLDRDLVKEENGARKARLNEEKKELVGKRKSSIR